jgi:hypothetical protein
MPDYFVGIVTTKNHIQACGDKKASAEVYFFAFFAYYPRKPIYH